MHVCIMFQNKYLLMKKTSWNSSNEASLQEIWILHEFYPSNIVNFINIYLHKHDLTWSTSISRQQHDWPAFMVQVSLRGQRKNGVFYQWSSCLSDSTKASAQVTSHTEPLDYLFPPAPPHWHFRALQCINSSWWHFAKKYNHNQSP